MLFFVFFFGWELFRAKATYVLEFPSTKPVGCVILCTVSCLAQARKGPSVHRPDASPVRSLRDTCGYVSSAKQDPYQIYSAFVFIGTVFCLSGGADSSFGSAGAVCIYIPYPQWG